MSHSPDGRELDAAGEHRAGDVPRFVVVGHPNKGKSSIVATLAEDNAVLISPLPGTTTEARRYPLRVDGEVLYELFDTPGFQRPREALAWLVAHAPAPHERSASIVEFVREHRNDPRFHDECALLEPALDSAGVLYVVDGSKPYGLEYEAEMEILRWTGRPRMALVNPISGSDYVDEWRRALDQCFSIVRVFDPTRADFDARVALLRGLGELAQPWRARIEHAIEVLHHDRGHRRSRSAAEIATLLLDVAARQVRRPAAVGESDLRHPSAGAHERAQAELTEKLLSQIRAREEDCRTQIESIYRHSGLSRQEQAASLLSVDLFSAESWQVFGLSNTQLAAAGVLSGALAGGGVDALLGGTSFLLGAATGALLGGVGGFLGTRSLAKAKVLGLPLGGREIVVGPVQDPNFAWVILGRALQHHRLVCERNHARREALVLDPADPGARPMQAVAGEVRREVDKILAKVRGLESVNPKQRDDLEVLISTLLVP